MKGFIVFKRTAVSQLPITIGDSIVLTVLGIKDGRVTIEIDAPVGIRAIRRCGGSDDEKPRLVSPQQVHRDPG